MDIAARGIRNPDVLQAMGRVPRHLFVPPGSRDLAYDDRPLPIGLGQTISQPYIVAYMTETLRLARDQTVLEIGTGSGYQAAVLAELAREVLTIEIVPELAERARQTLAEAGYKNIQVRTGNGYLGWPERAPFQRIIVTAAPENDSSGARRSARRRWHHGRPRRPRFPADDDRDENGHRRHEHADDARAVRADGRASMNAKLSTTEDVEDTKDQTSFDLCVL